MQQNLKRKGLFVILMLLMALLLLGVGACLIGKGKACDADTACPTELACIQGWCLPPNEFGDLRNETTGTNPDAATKD